MSVLISIDKLRPDPQNPRRAGVGDVTELAESMTAVGVLQPLLVTPDPEVPDGFLVVFGHRRLAGAIAAKLSEVPAEVRELDPVDRLAIQLVENMQRAEIDALDEALAFKRSWTLVSPSTPSPSGWVVRRATSPSASRCCASRPRPARPSIPAESRSPTPSS
ncbi:MAG: ParB/RepB/Spo0J family partition protein [Acidimicrobiia bacterium]